MTKDDSWDQALGHLLKIERKGGYIDYVRDRWSDEDVLKVYHHARRLEKRKWQKKMREKEKEMTAAIREAGEYQ